jgi:hypothetical protein
MVFSSTDLVLRQLTRQIDAADEPTWPRFAARVPESPPEVPPGPSGYSLGATMLPALHRVNRQYYRALTDHRLAATALAARLYVLDHGGQLPKALNDLVPGYLTAVPLDALSPEGAGLHYVSDPKDPRVYSVGLNGIDNGGIEPAPLMSSAERERSADDVICHLKRQPRPKPVEYPAYPGLPPGMVPGMLPGIPPPSRNDADVPTGPNEAMEPRDPSGEEASPSGRRAAE